MLLIHRDTVVSTDRLADAVFAGEPTPAAATTLRSYVARFRKVVDGVGRCADARHQCARLRVAGPVRRVRRRRLRAAARRRDRLPRPRRCCPTPPPAPQRALGLWRGPAYAEFADEDWARPEAQRLEELRLVTHERFVEAELARGRAAEVISTLEALVVEQSAARGLLAPTGHRPLPRRPPGGSAACGAATCAPCSARRSGWTRRRRWSSSSVRSSTTTRRCSKQPSTPDGSAATTSASASARGRDGTVYVAHLAGVDRELVDPDHARASWPTPPASCATSRPRRDGSPASAIPV